MTNQDKHSRRNASHHRLDVPKDEVRARLCTSRARYRSYQCCVANAARSSHGEPMLTIKQEMMIVVMIDKVYSAPLSAMASMMLLYQFF